MNKINTVIIGGGISGLSTGHFLKKKGVDFVIIESNKKTGGVINSVKKMDLFMRMDQILF